MPIHFSQRNNAKRQLQSIDRRGIPAWVLASALALAVLSGCGIIWWSTSGAFFNVRAHSSQELVVLLSSGIRGRLSPCICDGELAGGVAYRSGYVRTAPADALQLDLGNVPSGITAEEIERSGDILALLQGLGCTIINVAQTEIRAGAAYITRHRQQYVSCNVFDHTGVSLAREYVTTEAHGVPLAISGVSFAQTPGEGVTLAPPAEALARLLPSLTQAADLRLLLVDGTQEQAQMLATDFPEFALILFTGTGESVSPYRFNRSWLSSIYEGRYIGRLTLDLRTSPLMMQGEAVVLNLHNSGGVSETIDGKAQAEVLSGLEIMPKEIVIGGFPAGETLRQRIHISNRAEAAVRIGRVLSTCACVVLNVPELTIKAGDTQTIELEIKSLGLKGENVFPVYIEVFQNERRGIGQLRVITGTN